MKYNWKKALANAATVFLGVIMTRIGDGNVPTDWMFWKHVLAHAAEITGIIEIRYVYAWLLTFNGNQPPPVPPPIPPVDIPKGGTP